MMNLYADEYRKAQAIYDRLPPGQRDTLRALYANVYYDAPPKDVLQKLAGYEGMYKRFWAPLVFPDTEGVPNIAVFKSANGYHHEQLNRTTLDKFAEKLQLEHIPEEFTAIVDQHPATDTEYNVIIAAVGAYESWGFNDMGDGFFEEELLNYLDTYPKYGSVYYRHRHTERFRFGKVLAAYWDDLMKRVVVLARVDLASAPREVLEALLAADNSAAMTSMGAKVAYDVCSYCGNIARVPKEHCTHVARFRHAILAGGKYEDQVGMYNFRPIFYDISFVPRNAWPASYVLKVFERNKMLDTASILVEEAIPGDPPGGKPTTPMTAPPANTGAPSLGVAPLLRQLFTGAEAVKTAEAPVDKVAGLDLLAPHFLALFAHDPKPLPGLVLKTLLAGPQEPMQRFGCALGRAARLGLLLSPPEFLALLFGAFNHPAFDIILRRGVGLPIGPSPFYQHPRLTELLGVTPSVETAQELLHKLIDAMDAAPGISLDGDTALTLARRMQARPLVALRIIKIIKPGNLDFIERRAAAWDAVAHSTPEELAGMVKVGSSSDLLKQLLTVGGPAFLLYNAAALTQNPDRTRALLGLGGAGLLAALLLGSLLRGGAMPEAERNRQAFEAALMQGRIPDTVPTGTLYTPEAAELLRRVQRGDLQGRRAATVGTTQAGKQLPPASLQYAPNTVAALANALAQPVTYSMHPDALALLDQLRRTGKLGELFEDGLSKEAAFPGIVNLFKRTKKVDSTIPIWKQVLNQWLIELSPRGVIGGEVAAKGVEAYHKAVDRATQGIETTLKKIFGEPPKQTPLLKQTLMAGAAGLGLSLLTSASLNERARRGTLNPYSRITRIQANVAQQPLSTAALFAMVPPALAMAKHIRAELEAELEN